MQLAANGEWPLLATRRIVVKASSSWTKKSENVAPDHFPRAQFVARRGVVAEVACFRPGPIRHVRIEGWLVYGLEQKKKIQ